MPRPPDTTAGIEDWVTLARLLRPQGRKGELLADLFTDFPERFDDHPEVFLRAPGQAPAPARVESHWLPLGRNAGRIVLKFAAVDSITAAEALEGREVVIPPESRLPLPEDEAYVTDLIGCTVVNAGEIVGIIEDVHFASTPDGAARLHDAPDLLVVHSPAGHEHLIPFVKGWILARDLEAKSIEMALPAGLLDINR